MWNQVYDPLHSPVLSTIAAAVPVVTLLVLIASGRVQAHIAAVIAVIVANLITIFVFTMPANMSIRASVLGIVTGFFPIGWIVLNVIFLYQVTVSTGRFELLKRAIGGVTEDRRLQLLLIAFSFGAFFEGASGFGTPVAITGAVLIGLGFSPLAASGLSLIANTAPVAYGALGTPIQGLASVTGLDPYILGAMVGRQLPVFSLIVPFWVVWAFAGWKGMKDVWPAILVTGVSFAIPQFVISNFINPWIVDIGASLISMGALILFLKVWQPRQLWLSPALRGRDESAATMAAAKPLDKTPLTQSELFGALLPWIIVCIVMLIWGNGAFKAWANSIFVWNYPVPELHQMINKMPPVAPGPTKESAVFGFTYLSFTGTGMLIAAIISGVLMGVGPGKLVTEYGRTIRLCAISLITISAMLAIGTLTRRLRRRRDARPRLRRNRRALSLLRHAARLVGRGADGIGHRLQRAVRKPAEDHLRAARPVAGPDGCGELVRRRDGQDDRRAVDRGRLHCHQLVRARGHDPALRVLALDRAGLSRRRARDVAGLCLAVHGNGPEVAGQLRLERKSPRGSAPRGFLRPIKSHRAPG
ncbi:lactate permease [Bradyrhizobium ottawaense]